MRVILMPPSPVCLACQGGAAGRPLHVRGTHLRCCAVLGSGLYQYLSSQVRLAAGSDYAKPSTLSLMRAQNSASGRNATMHGPSEAPPAMHSIRILLLALPSCPAKSS